MDKPWNADRVAEILGALWSLPAEEQMGTLAVAVRVFCDRGVR